MAKITPLSDITTLSNQPSAIATMNTNNDRIETAFQNTLSRDGSANNSQIQFSITYIAPPTTV